MNIAGIGAAQATSSGRVADSAKIGRNASTIALISDKTPEEIENDGLECGNKKLRVCLNRNGAQMAADEYIDLVIDFIELLPRTIVVERFVSQSPKDLLIAPDWGLKNYEFTAKLEKRLVERDTFQGRAFSSLTC